MVIASALFCIGLYNVMTRKNAVAILMGIELILNSANINFVAFNRFISSTNLDDSNPSVNLANLITGTPVIYYPHGLAPVAIRFKNSLWENAWELLN